MSDSNDWATWQRPAELPEPRAHERVREPVAPGAPATVRAQPRPPRTGPAAVASPDGVPEAASLRAGCRPPVGREVRRWRRTRALTLAQLGEASGLNTGYLSQIENDKAVPSLDALVAVAAALDVPPAWLLMDAAPAPRVVRAGQRPSFPVQMGGRATEVDGGTARDVSIVEAVAPPGSRTGIHVHPGDEHHVVLGGRFRMTQGEHVIELGPGDYLAWDPAVPHDVESIGPETGRILIIYPRHARSAGADSRGGAGGSRGGAGGGATRAR